MSRRILRINQLIKKELSQIILKEVEFPVGTLVTVTRVDTAPNLSQAKVYISSLPEEKNAKALQILKGQIYQIQQELNKRLEIKIVPRLNFLEELKTKEAGRIEELLEKIKKKVEK